MLRWWRRVCLHFARRELRRRRIEFRLASKYNLTGCYHYVDTLDVRKAEYEVELLELLLGELPEARVLGDGT